jgi:cytochrome c-type biogenesis protein CcmH/NrfG
MTVKNMFNVDDDEEVVQEQKPKKRMLPLLSETEFDQFKAKVTPYDEEEKEIAIDAEEARKQRDEEQRKRIEMADRLLQENKNPTNSV